MELGQGKTGDNIKLLLLQIEVFTTIIVVKYTTINPFYSTFLNSFEFKDLICTMKPPDNRAVLKYRSYNSKIECSFINERIASKTLKLELFCFF